MNPSDPLQVVLIGRPAHDPALHIDHPQMPKLLSAYERSRSDADRKALPLLPASLPCLFTVRPLTAAGVRYVREMPTEDTQAHRTIAVACHEYTDARGVTHRAQEHGQFVELNKQFSLASEEWIDHLLVEFGAAALREIAQVVVQRAEAGPRAIAPFKLPRGSMLPV